MILSDSVTSLKIFLMNFKTKFAIAQWVSFLLLLFTQIANQNLFSQSNAGIQIGRSYSKFEVTQGMVKLYDFSSEFDHQGLFARLIFSHSLNKFFCVKSGLGYVLRGTTILRDYTIVGHDKFSFNYINLPISIGISPIKYLAFEGGLSTNYLIRATHFWSKDKYKRYDIGVETGISILFKNFSIRGAYFHSLTPVWVLSHPSVVDPNDQKHYNRSLEFSIGYQFDLKKRG
jgi:high-affinity Fe2+/Pb2+ permease